MSFKEIAVLCELTLRGIIFENKVLPNLKLAKDVIKKVITIYFLTYRIDYENSNFKKLNYNLYINLSKYSNFIEAH